MELCYSSTRWTKWQSKPSEEAVFPEAEKETAIQNLNEYKLLAEHISNMGNRVFSKIFYASFKITNETLNMGQRLKVKRFIR